MKRRISAVIFDLDNVLFDERDYVISAYREIASFLSGCCTVPEARIFEKLVHDLDAKGSMYPRLFNDVVKDLGLNEALVPEILQIYNNVLATVTLYPGVESLLRRLRKNEIKLGLVTNGSVSAQWNKVQLLGLEKFFDVIIYARDVGRGREKPDPESYRVALERLGAGAGETVCVGDNPYTDFFGARQLGMSTVRLLAGEFKEVELSEEYEADIFVHTLDEIKDVIEIEP